MRNFLLVGVIAAFIIPNQLLSQCNPYFDYEEGTSLVQTTFDKKGKEQASQKLNITSVTNEGDKVIMLTDVTIYDKKGKEITSNQMELICEEGVFKMDMSRFVPPGMDQMEGVSISFEGDNIEMPKSLSVGKNLKDATFTVNIESDNPALSTMMGGTNTTISNRKVLAQESITTAAGTFDCFKISYDSKVETKMMGMTRSFDTKGIEWISEGVGLVRVESYDKKGNLSSYTELTSFKK